MKILKRTAKLLMLALIAVIAISFSQPEQVSAKVKVKNVEKDFSKVYTDGKNTITTDCRLEYIQLKGSKSAYKKINKSIKAMAAQYVPTVNELVEELQGDYSMNDELSDVCNIGISYEDKKYVNIYFSEYYYGGGVVNSFYSGSVYSLKTGKKVPITTFTGMSLKKIRKTLINLIDASGEFDSFEDIYKPLINSMKAEDFSYFINKDKTVTVTFGPYALGWGGSFYSVVFEY